MKIFSDHIHAIRDLILGDDALIYITYVMVIWVAPIPATRCHCSLAIANTLA